MKRILATLAIFVGLATATATRTESPMVRRSGKMIFVSCSSGALHISGAIVTSVNVTVPKPGTKDRWFVTGLEIPEAQSAAGLSCDVD